MRFENAAQRTRSDKEYQNKKVARNRAHGAPEAVDVHIGRRVRMRRTLLGISQAELAEALGLTFQQVLKIRAWITVLAPGDCILYPIFLVFRLIIFDGILPPFNRASQKIGLSVSSAEQRHDPMLNRETLELVRAYYKINDPLIRRRIFELTKQLEKTFDDKMKIDI